MGAPSHLLLPSGGGSADSGGPPPVLDAEVVGGPGTPDPKARLAALVAHGTPLMQAAEAAGVPADTAALWAQSADFEALVAQSLPSDASVRQMFLSEAARNVQALRDFRDDPGVDAKVRLRAVQDMLDRAGYTPVRRVAVATFRLDPAKKEFLDRVVDELHREGD